MRTPARATALIPLLVAVLPALAAAQVIQGTVVESGSRAPIAAVEVILQDAVGDRMMRGMVVTDSLGRFTISTPLAGRYLLHLRRIGYATQTTKDFEVGSGETVVLQLSMSTEYLKLDSLVVVERRRRTPAAIVQFRERAEWVRKTGRGKVYFADELKGIGSARSLYLLNASSRGCPMTVLVDNLPISDPRELDYLAEEERIEGIEIYRGPTLIPEQFQHHKACALMLVWTKPLPGNRFSWLRILAGGALAALLLIVNR